MKRIHISYYERGEFLITYRICPNFLESGYRVFRKREYEKNETCNEHIFSTEEEAIMNIVKRVNTLITMGKATNLKLEIYEAETY